MHVTRRRFIGLTAAGIGGLALGPTWSHAAESELPANSFGNLYRQFNDPDRRFSIRPFWFWNGKLDAAELRRQMAQMVEHGVYGAYAHNRDGLQTPYLSEEWWNVLGEALAAADELGFSLCMVDDFEWPSGEARDYWLPGVNKSRVVAANPDFQARRLRPEETHISGPRDATIPLHEGTLVAVAGKVIGEKALDGNSLIALPLAQSGNELRWHVPEGDWIVFTYTLERTVLQPDHGTVDLMSREAVAEYIKIYYEEFLRRHGKHFGKAMPATFADHEGSYGGKLPWTPGIFEAFEKRAGYHLQQYLPALTYEIGDKTEKVRCDLLDTVSELYCENFFKQVSDWCDQHKIAHSAHVWEETLLFGPSYQGDYFRILRSMTNPGCDSLAEWGRQSIWLKEIASVAEFEGRHVVCENQGVQGSSSYLSPERLRRVSNGLGAWNIGEYIPHAFDYDLTRTNYPPDWFRSQPFLNWFRSYADQMRRVSFINRESESIADFLLYYPQVSVWGQSAPSFSDSDRLAMTGRAYWTQDAKETDDQFAELKLRMSEARLDYQVADDYYLGRSTIEGSHLNIANARFHTLILPPASTIRRASAELVKKFYDAGGTVIALRRLPTISTESGRNDPTLAKIWSDIFDDRPSRAAFRLKKNSAGGKAYFIQRSVTELLSAIQDYAKPDVRVLEGPTDSLHLLHKVKSGVQLYWVVNDTPQSRTNLLSLRATGKPERWDAETAERSPLFYQSLENRTAVRLSLGPWDSAYIAFDAAGPAQPLSLEATNLDDLHVTRATADAVTVTGKSLVEKGSVSVTLAQDSKRYKGSYTPKACKPVTIEGAWKVTPLAKEIPLPYAQVAEDPVDRGLKAGWAIGDHDGVLWQPLWLSPMSRSLRDWNILGPFPNPEDLGFEHSYPPEKTIDYRAIYSGESARQLRWQEIRADDYRIFTTDHEFGIGTMATDGGPNGANSFYVRYDGIFGTQPPSGTVYAQSNVYSPVETDAVLALCTPSPHQVFLNGDKVYSRWVRPLYNDMTDGFSTHIDIHLHSGWNNLLFKFLHNPDANFGGGTFLSRIQHKDGSVIENLFCSTRTHDDVQTSAAQGYRWLRLSAPPLASALLVPAMKRPWLVFMDGVQVKPGHQLTLKPGTQSIALRVAAEEPLVTPFAFSAQEASMPLGSLKIPGMEYYSGQMSYEKTVTIPSELLNERLLLDCGEVGVVCEAWINGKSAGARAWAPYVFDITEQAHAGSNTIKVVVANTESNGRAVGQNHDLLDRIDLDGWHGPARLVPYLSREIQLRRTT